MIKTHRSCENCNIEFQSSNIISKQYPNLLNNFCETCYVTLIQNNNNIPEDSKNLRNNQILKEKKNIKLSNQSVSSYEYGVNNKSSHL